jgi:alpha-D-ribose 1-methylphosphonate 5-phosphate C-P lyase
MKKLLLLFVFSFGFLQAQMPNISNVWTNNLQLYNGVIGKSEPLKIMINNAKQNIDNDQEYIVSGHSIKNNETQKIYGKLEVTKYKDSKKHGKIFGKYELTEEGNSKLKGNYKGKFVFSFDWEPTTRLISNKQIKFVGDFITPQNNEKQKAEWANF